MSTSRTRGPSLDKVFFFNHDKVGVLKFPFIFFWSLPSRELVTRCLTTLFVSHNREF